ncbi:MAG TPA: 2-amino-4-hydroxy-6-hydroxymethyldihydropteridine diphosphokinase [Stellaceae bacterium]|nr:2-amino-4-hydroxy-6-hydroxymethyldihydropteridine diphosphokinase [Stellaceae bacterium]
MILLGLGANLPSDLGPPVATLAAALDALGAEGVRLVRRSAWYRSPPVPPSAQPWYVNGVVQVQTTLAPGDLLALLHRIEARFGRVRGEVNAARSLDLDLLDYEGRVSDAGDTPILPHPRLHERAFVLLPLRDVAPDWGHPRLGRTIADLVAALGEMPGIERI